MMPFSSRAKLLLTGEYLVMLGAQALALPLKFGQSLTIEETDGGNMLHWAAMEKGNTWFEAKYDLINFALVSTTDKQIASTLCKVLTAAREINPDFLNKSKSFGALTNIDFNRQWGLGTSSSLISNIAWWANIDPFQLHWKVSEGSGYDIACARETSPIIYSVINQMPSIERVNFAPPFTNNIYFVYLGKKQNSAISIQQIDRNTGKYKKEIELISSITNDFAYTTSFGDAKKLIEAHEEIIGSVLKQAPVRKLLFSDFQGTIKSMGAWGGDFIMALSEEPAAYVQNYFRKKHLEVIFTFKEIMVV